MVGVRRWLDRFRLERGGWVEERRRVDDGGIGVSMDWGYIVYELIV